MSTGQRHPYTSMSQLSASLFLYLEPAARRLDVAGSIRRYDGDPKRPEDAKCGDIELVLDADHDAVMDLLRAKPAGFTEISGGERLVKFTWNVRTGEQIIPIPVQLNFATTLTSLMWGVITNYGWKLLLATGDAEWNQLIALERKHGGLKPPHIHKADKPNAPTSGFLHIEGEPQHTPTEQEVFNLLGLPFVPPHRRNAVTARELRAQLSLHGAL